MERERLADSDPPFFFRRVWTEATDMDEVTLFSHLPDGTLQVMVGVPRAEVPPEIQATAVETIPLAADGLVIYGRGVKPETMHDREYAAAMAARGQVWAECFSVQCVDGETGTHPLAAVTEIGRGEFEAARRRGWTS